MKGLKLLEAIIEKHEELLEIAELQIMQNIHNTGSAGNPYKGWPREKARSEKILKVLKSIKEGFDEDLKKAKADSIKVANLYEPHRSWFSVPRLCWSNYRVILLLNTQTLMIDPFFWTPELGIDNSHHALMVYAQRNYRSDNGAPIHDISYCWGGFYTYGLGNCEQKQLTLYGESSDYPHDRYSEKVKEHFLSGKQVQQWEVAATRMLPPCRLSAGACPLCD